MERIEIIQKRLNDIEDACMKVWEEYMDKALENIPHDVAWKWYKSQPLIQEQRRLESELRSLKEPKNFEPIERDDNIYTLEQFIGICKCGGFINYDGFGVYAYKDKKSDIEIYPSDVISGNVRTDFTHVVWYNR